MNAEIKLWLGSLGWQYDPDLGYRDPQNLCSYYHERMAVRTQRERQAMNSEVRKAIELAFIFQFRADSSDIDLYVGPGGWAELDWYKPGRDCDGPLSYGIKKVGEGYEFVEV